MFSNKEVNKRKSTNMNTINVVPINLLKVKIIKPFFGALEISLIIKRKIIVQQQCKIRVNMKGM